MSEAVVVSYVSVYVSILSKCFTVLYTRTHIHSLSLVTRTHTPCVCVNCAYFALIFVFFSMHIQFFSSFVLIFICFCFHWYTFFFICCCCCYTRKYTHINRNTNKTKITNKTTTEKNLLVFSSLSWLLRMFSLAAF